MKLFKTSPLTYAALLGAAITFSAWAQPTAKLYDDFEDGNLTGWTLLGTPAMTISPAGTNIVPAGGNYAVTVPSSASRIWRNFTPSPPSQAYDSYRASCWLYDSNTANINSRAFMEVRATSNNSYSGGALIQILAIGVYNSWSVAPMDAAKYSGRVLTGSPGGWFTLNSAPNRSVGWHKFAIERGTNSAGQCILKFYQDEILGAIFTNVSSVASYVYSNWSTAVFGLGAGSSAADEFMDGFEVVQGQAFIGDEPKGKTNLLGDTVTMSVGASGSADPLSFWWYKDGVLVENGGRVSGANAKDLVISAAEVGDSGYYGVAVSNYWGVRTSSIPARLYISGVNITLQPTNKIANLGSSNVSFYAQGYGVGTVTYQWKKDGVDIPTATDAIYTIPVVGPSDIATNPGYACLISNGTDALSTAAATLRSNSPPILGTVTNTQWAPGATVVITPPVSDDFSSLGLFQTYESGSVTTFSAPHNSGSTSPLYVETGSLCYITNSFPANPGSGLRTLYMQMNFTNTALPGWVRVGTPSYNPIISFAGPTRFNIRTDKAMGVCMGIRETFPTGNVGANGGGSGPIEFAGVTQGGNPPLPLYYTTANTWTNFQFELQDTAWWAYSYVYPSGLIAGNDGILDGGRGVFESLCLTPQASNGTYKVWVDNLQSVDVNPLTMSLVSGPAGATLDPYTGLIVWQAPGTPGNHNFSVAATDHLGLSTTNNFTVVVAVPAPPREPLTYQVLDGSLVLSWTNTVWTLQSANDAAGTYSTVSGATSPYTNSLSAAPKYYRLQWSQ